MIDRMDDAVQASRLETLIMRDHEAVIGHPARKEHPTRLVKLTAKGQKRLDDLINERFR